ncbi:unnamed protein product, partial [Hymenolepis diminuta]
VSQINPATLRKFLPEHASGVFVVLKFHFKNNNIRSQINKFHILNETNPASFIVQFANIIQQPSSNPYGDFKAAILKHTQSFVAERVQKLPQQKYVGDMGPIALLTRMKLLAPGESFDRAF